MSLPKKYRGFFKSKVHAFNSFEFKKTRKISTKNDLMQNSLRTLDPEKTMSQKKRIILIEDEEDIAALIKLQAEISGYVLHVEVDGINGLRAIEREKPDLVILDIMLPGQNGFDVCRKMKSNSDLKNIPIIILTAKAEELDVILGLELGADDYIAKPFSPKVLF